MNVRLWIFLNVDCGFRLCWFFYCFFFFVFCDSVLVLLLSDVIVFVYSIPILLRIASEPFPSQHPSHTHLSNLAKCLSCILYPHHPTPSCYRSQFSIFYILQFWFFVLLFLVCWSRSYIYEVFSLAYIQFYNIPR